MLFSVILDLINKKFASCIAPIEAEILAIFGRDCNGKRD